MTTEIDDDHFDYEGGMRQCISGFGRNAKECLQDLASHPNSDAAWKSCQWHIDELVRWCRGLTRQRIVISQELIGCGNGYTQEVIDAICDGTEAPTNDELKTKHERNTITCPVCGERTTVDTRCVEDCDECGTPIAYTVIPLNERCH